jgi:hypothetical protein
MDGSHLGQGRHTDAHDGVTGDQKRIRDVMKTKTPARVILRAQIFDDADMSQGGQLCQTLFAF